MGESLLISFDYAQDDNEGLSQFFHIPNTKTPTKSTVGAFLFTLLYRLFIYHYLTILTSHP